jgi:uncharacterized protein (TIGR03083 family)
VSNSERSVTLLDKDDVLAGVFASWDAIAALLADLTADEWRTATALPGWDVHDVVAHMVGTESMLLGLATPEPDVDLATVDHVRNFVGEMNEPWVRFLRPESGAQLLERFRDVTAQRRAALAAIAIEEWNAPTQTPAGPDSYGRFMRIRAFDCWMHEQDIRAALGRAPSAAQLVGADARQSLDEMAACMSFVVGKKGQAPEGSRVLLELTGPLSREIRVAVDGRAALVEDFGGAEPTTVVTLDGLQFTRLAGGRGLVDYRPADVGYSGDAVLGARIVENLAYVI